MSFIRLILMLLLIVLLIVFLIKLLFVLYRNRKPFMQYLANVQTNVAALAKQSHASSKQGAASGVASDQDFADILKASNEQAAKKQSIENAYQQKSVKKALTSTDNTASNQHKKNEKINNPANQTTSKDEFADNDISSTPEKQTDKPATVKADNVSDGDSGDNSDDSSVNSSAQKPGTDSDSNSDNTFGTNQTFQADEQKTHNTSQQSRDISPVNSPTKNDNHHSVADSFMVESADAELILAKPAKQTAKLENADEFDFLNFLQKAQNNKAELKSVDDVQVKVDGQSKNQLKAENVVAKAVNKNDVTVENVKSEIEQSTQALATAKASDSTIKQTSLNQAESAQKLDGKKAGEPNEQKADAKINGQANSQAAEVKSAKSDTLADKPVSESSQQSAAKQSFDETQSITTDANSKAIKENKSLDGQSANQQAVLAQTQQKEKEIQQSNDDDKIAEQTVVQSLKSETSTDKKADTQNIAQTVKAEPSKLSSEVKQALQSLNTSKDAQTEIAKEQSAQDKPVIDQASLELSVKQEAQTQQARTSEQAASLDHKSATAQVSQQVNSQQVHRQEQQFQQADKNVEKQQSLHHQLKEQLNLSKNDSANALNDSVRYMMNSRIQSAEIRIDPPELGSMQIKISMNGDQASVSMVVQNQQAKDMLDQSVPKLKEMLEQQGIELGESNISEHQHNGEQQAGQSHGNGHSAQHEEGTVSEPHQVEQTIKNGHIGAVDYYA